MEKLDLKKQLTHLYRASALAVGEVEVPTLKFLMIDGQGDPNHNADYAAAVEALFSIAYTLKFMVKKSTLAIDYGVMPLEGLWWADEMAAFVEGRRNEWRWTMMIMQPDFITTDMFITALQQVRKKLGAAALAQLRFDTFTEGHCAQILHQGPFSEEGPTIERLHHYIKSKSACTGKHHEIYLSDIRRATPGNWKTILRQPMTTQ